jgi:hypothetical protein
MRPLQSGKYGRVVCRMHLISLFVARVQDEQYARSCVHCSEGLVEFSTCCKKSRQLPFGRGCHEETTVCLQNVNTALAGIYKCNAYYAVILFVIKWRTGATDVRTELRMCGGGTSRSCRDRGCTGSSPFSATRSHQAKLWEASVHLQVGKLLCIYYKMHHSYA